MSSKASVFGQSPKAGSYKGLRPLDPGEMLLVASGFPRVHRFSLVLKEDGQRKPKGTLSCRKHPFTPMGHAWRRSRQAGKYKGLRLTSQWSRWFTFVPIASLLKVVARRVTFHLAEMPNFQKEKLGEEAEGVWFGSFEKAKAKVSLPTPYQLTIRRWPEPFTPALFSLKVFGVKGDFSKVVTPKVTCFLVEMPNFRQENLVKSPLRGPGAEPPGASPPF